MTDFDQLEVIIEGQWRDPFVSDIIFRKLILFATIRGPPLSTTNFKEPI